MKAVMVIMLIMFSAVGFADGKPAQVSKASQIKPAQLPHPKVAVHKNIETVDGDQDEDALLSEMQTAFEQSSENVDSAKDSSEE